MPIKFIRINFTDGSSCYLQGFDVSGEPITGVKGVAHQYPEWMAPTAQRNAENNLRYHGRLKDVVIEDAG